MSTENHKIIGITGIIGSGKTTVAKHYQTLGYDVLYTDLISKEISENNPEIKSKIIKLLGEEAYIEEKLNGKYISNIVFNDPKKLDLLNRILHPAVIDKVSNICEELFNQGKELIFVESALMFETGTFEGYDYVIAVDCPEELAIERVMKRSNLSKEEITKRLKNQFDNNKKVALADFVISNKKDEKTLIAAADFILTIVETMPPKNFEEEE